MKYGKWSELRRGCQSMVLPVGSLSIEWRRDGYVVTVFGRRLKEPRGSNGTARRAAQTEAWRLLHLSRDILLNLPLDGYDS